MEHKFRKNFTAYFKLRHQFLGYIADVKEMPEGFTAMQLFWDYLKVRRQNPGRRVSMSEYMIFAFYRLSLPEQQAFLTDVEATLLMRPYNNESEKILKDKVCFLKTFRPLIRRDWIYLPETTEAEFRTFAQKHPVMAVKPPLSSWGIGFRKVDTRDEDLSTLYEDFRQKKLLAESYLTSDPALAKFHPASLNSIRVITASNPTAPGAPDFAVFGAGLRVGNGGRNVDNAHCGGIFCEIDPSTGIVCTDGLDECGNVYLTHPVTGVPFRGQVIPHWDDILRLCRKASETLPCLHIVGWDVAVLADGSLELIEGNHNPGMNIVQAPAKHGRKQEFIDLLRRFYGEPETAEKADAAAGEKPGTAAVKAAGAAAGAEPAAAPEGGPAV